MKISEILLADGVPLSDVDGEIYRINKDFLVHRNHSDQLVTAHDHWEVGNDGAAKAFFLRNRERVPLGDLKADFFASVSACRAEARKRLDNAILHMPV